MNVICKRAKNDEDENGNQSVVQQECVGVTMIIEWKRKSRKFK